MRPPFLLTAGLPALALAACTPSTQHLHTAPPPPRNDWALASDIPVDPAFRFGKLANGMRYAIRRNATPKGTAMVRMEIEAGSLDEDDGELGYAHFIEHMAFNGSTHVPEGEMVKLLERDGLAFGADTNAQTSFGETLFMLDLPRADPALLNTVLMLMRETASELTIDPAAVTRERGVVLSELRDRNSWQLHNAVEQIKFTHPAARYGQRMPIGTTQSLENASAETLKIFWKREYVPKHATVVVVGDFDPDLVETEIRRRFGDWQGPAAEPQPDAGPVDPKDNHRTDVYLDPALSERVTVSRNGEWIYEPDSVAQRRENLLREIGTQIINRRLLRLTRQPDPPFRGAGFGSSDVFRAARTSQLLVDTVDRKWQRGLIAAAQEYRRAMRYGFTAGEVAEQVAIIRNNARNAAASAQTRDNRALVSAVISFLRDDVVPSTPESGLERLEAFIPQITPDAVLAAVKREAVPLKDPLLRFSGRTAPEGGAAAVRAAWDSAMRPKVSASTSATQSGFGYTDFGPPSAVVSDTRESQLGIREVRFANGVRLNLKHSDLEKDRVLVQFSLDGGDMLATRNNPLAVEMADNLSAGGLGKHSQDDLQSILAGRTVGVALTSTPETFVASAQTTPGDLELQLQLYAAMITDPGYRPEGESLYRLSINNFFARYKATPNDALHNSIGGLLSDNDPRFTLQPVDDYRKLTFAKLKSDITDRLARGAIEIGLVGDFDEEKAITLVGKTLGALPPREPDFRAYPDQRQRPFTADHSSRLVRHTGAKDQAMLRLVWPTRDGEDPVEAMKLQLMEKLVQIALTDTLREALGKAYSPGAFSEISRVWRGYGTFSINASVDVGDVAASRAAILKALADLRAHPVSADMLRRASEPMLEAFDNALKTNRNLLSLVDRAQTEPDRIERQLKARERLSALTPVDILAEAQRYLTPEAMVEVLVLPEGVDPPPAP
ncbi:MAG: insulinase family protein [Novosphingobium sp.]